MILIIDNYDSFVYNLYQYLAELAPSERVVVKRNDQITIAEIEALNAKPANKIRNAKLRTQNSKPEAIILSPGPGHPANKKDFGVCGEILANIRSVPILGVCLGHQGIIHHFGGVVERNVLPMHGKISMVEHNGLGIFKGVKTPVRVMRYHSLVGTKIPDCLDVTARALDDGAVMAVQHKTLPIYGVQFHPESIMTEYGKAMLKNFLLNGKGVE